MINFIWTIIGVEVDDDNFITSANYHVKAQDEENFAETSGNLQFHKQQNFISYNQITESQIIHWIKEKTTENDENSIELNLQKQLKNLKSYKSAPLPWLIDTFTIE